jgi:chloramphenicol 3-O-phosphotransferase
VQSAQYEVSVEACCALARVFWQAGYDIAVDDVFEPEPFERHWRPSLSGIDYRLVIVRPSLEETQRRAALREKRVRPGLIEAQHAATGLWPDTLRIDTTGLTVEESLSLVSVVTAADS